MSNHQTTDGRVRPWRVHLRRLIGLVGLAGLTSAAMASVQPTDEASPPDRERLEQRVEAVRQALAKAELSEGQTSTSEVAQWNNWNNWNNWRNWGNV